MSVPRSLLGSAEKKLVDILDLTRLPISNQSSLTTIVDRSYSVADEDGKVIALVRLGWTIVVALICVGAFKWRFLGQMLLVYPELYFITLSIILLLGLYTSKKILDYPHLHFLTEKRANKKKKTVDPVPRPHEDYTI